MIDESQVWAAARSSRRRVAVGLLHPHPECVEALRRAHEFVDVIVVGPKRVDGLAFVESSSAERLVSAVAAGDADAFFRGNFGDLECAAAIRKQWPLAPPTTTWLVPLLIRQVRSLAEPLNRVVCFGPLSPFDDWSLSSRIAYADSCIAFFKRVGVQPQLGILSAGAPEDISQRVREADASLAEAEFLVNWYTKRGVVAKHFAHQLEYALLESNLVLFQNTFAGNQAIRAMMFVGDTRVFGGISTNLPITYAQVPEAFRSWDLPLAFLCATLNQQVTG